MRLAILMLLASCACEISTMEIAPRDFDGPVSGASRWKTARAALPEATCAVDVRFRTPPAGDGLTIGVLSYATESSGRYVIEHEGLLSADGLQGMSMADARGPLKLIVINQAEDLGYDVINARAWICH